MFAQRPPSPRSEFPPPAVDLEGLKRQWKELQWRFNAIEAGPDDRSRLRENIEQFLENANAFLTFAWEEYLKCLDLQSYTTKRIAFAEQHNIRGYRKQIVQEQAELAAAEADIAIIYSQAQELVAKIERMMPQFVPLNPNVQAILTEINRMGGERIKQRLAEIARQLQNLNRRANQVVQRVMVPRMVRGAPAPGQPPPAASRDSNITQRNNLLSEEAQLNRQLNRWHRLRNLILEEGGAADAPAAANILKPTTLRF